VTEALHAFTIPCAGDFMQAILHEPAPAKALGVVIVVGGPQYRVGSHRQFVLLARELAAAGFATLRFDYRGMGDSTGTARTFESIEEDIRAAADALCERVPAVKEIALWGLCDAATAAAFYASRDARVRHLVLANPWVRSEAGLARSLLRRYYSRRLVDPQFWRDLVTGKLGVTRAIAGFFSTVRRSGRANTPASTPGIAVTPAAPLAARMADGLTAFKGRALFILSGADLTAGEFRDAIAASRRWRRLMRRPPYARRELSDADHTFSTRTWRDRVASLTRDWLRDR
jgi:uncharacterized protein